MKKRGFCEFSDNLYWGPKVKRKAIVKLNLYLGRGQFNVFCVTKAMNDNDQLDIIHCAFLRQPYYRKHPIFIYGIASSYNEAVDIVLKISEEASKAGMEGRLSEYLQRA